MGRIRSIKPEFFKHEGLYDLERRTGLPIRLAFAGLWCQADREGRFPWRPRPLKHEILPYDDVDFDRILTVLAEESFIVPYEVNGKRYAHIPTWNLHQKPYHREGDSRIPCPSESCAEARKSEGHGPEKSGLEPGKVRAIAALSTVLGAVLGGEGRDAAPLHSPAGEKIYGPMPVMGETPKLTDAVPVIDETPEGLAQQWCYSLSRKKHRASADDPIDLADDFRELIRLGHDPKVLLKTILDPGRDKGEFYWQFRDRVVGKRKGKKVGPAPTAASILAKAAKADQERKCQKQGGQASPTGTPNGPRDTP